MFVCSTRTKIITRRINNTQHTITYQAPQNSIPYDFYTYRREIRYVVLPATELGFEKEVCVCVCVNGRDVV